MLGCAESQDHWRQARQFVEEYGVALCRPLIQDFKYEVENLDTEYAGPGGVFLLAEKDSAYLGCIGLRRFKEGIGEIKRLYVAPAGRGHGVGRCLVEGVVAKARQIGYRRLVLDTLPSMKEAQKLYATLGFTLNSTVSIQPGGRHRISEKILH